jgi:hypothetical protein
LLKTSRISISLASLPFLIIEPKIIAKSVFGFNISRSLIHALIYGLGLVEVANLQASKAFEEL